MVKPVKIHDNNLWDKFVSDSEQYFAVLSPGTKVAFFVGETDKNFLLIERTEGAKQSCSLQLLKMMHLNFWMMQANFQISLRKAS